MVCRVGVASDALVADRDLPPPTLGRIHRELARALMAHGELIYSDRADLEQLVGDVRDLMSHAPDAGKAWEAILSGGRTAHASAPTPAPLRQVDDSAALQEWRQRVRVAFMERERLELLGAPEGAEVWQESNAEIELAVCAAPWQTQSLAALRELGEANVLPRGSSRAAIADERFLPLIERSKRIVLLDRFIGTNAIRGVELGRSELKWMLELIDGAGKGITVSVFAVADSAATPPYGESEIVSAADSIWNSFVHRGGVATFQLFLGPEKERNASGTLVFPHDRHFRFDRLAFAASAGLERLRRSTISGNWSLRYVWKETDIAALVADEDHARLLTGAPASTWSV